MDSQPAPRNKRAETWEIYVTTGVVGGILSYLCWTVASLLAIRQEHWTASVRSWEQVSCAIAAALLVVILLSRNGRPTRKD